MVLLACATTLPQNYLMNNVNKWKDVFRGFVVMWNTWRWEQRRMDALAHMLSDPLDPKEENDEQITEECMLGNCRVSLPEDLLEDVSCLAFSCEIILISAVSRFIFCFTYLHMLLFTSFYDSLKFSSLCWVKALGVKYWQIPSGSTFVSFCRSFLRTIVWSRTVPSVTYSIIQFLTLGTPFILHKNYSEVLTTLLYCWEEWMMLNWFLKQLLITSLVIPTQMVTSILRWSSTDNCVPSPRGNDRCTAFSSITTGCWSRSSSPERYLCFLSLWKIAHSLLASVCVCEFWCISCCRSCWTLQYKMVWTSHIKEGYQPKPMQKCGRQGWQEDWVA